MNVTKEGIEVVPGQLWRDLDKRMDRKRYVMSVSDGYAKMGITMFDPFPSRIAIRRMHKSSTGWALISPDTGGNSR